MDSDKLAYFKGWKDACDDLAKFLEQCHSAAPDELKTLCEPYLTIAKSVRERGEKALAFAESINSNSH